MTLKANPEPVNSALPQEKSSPSSAKMLAKVGGKVVTNKDRVESSLQPMLRYATS